MKNFAIFGDLKKAEEKFEITKKSYEKALEFFKELFEPIMPEHWQATFLFEDSRLLIINYSHNNEKEDAPLISFKSLCDVLTNAGYEVKKDTTDFGENYLFLDGKATYNKGGVVFEIHIRQTQVDKCEIEYKEVTEKKAVLSGFCAEVLK